MSNKEKKLRKLISEYCKEKNIIESAYLEGIMKYGPLSDKIIDNLIKLHKKS